MKLHGRRVHIVGSADLEADEAKLGYVHTLIAKLVSKLAADGATFVVPFGKEPFLKDRDSGPSIIFDWTVAEAVHVALKSGTARPAYPNGRLVHSLATSKTDSHIPANRRPLYEELRAASAVHLEFLEAGWSAGAFRRQRLAEVGDILIGVSGGEGVEHQSIEYSTRGKPVIPLDIRVGAAQRDGSGGAARLFERALAHPSEFFRVEDSHSAADLLDRTRTRDGQTDPGAVVTSVMNLIQGLLSPQVFYVRLLNDSLPEYAFTEAFFRDTVDPFVRDLGYAPLQMGAGKNEFAWMNQAIFDSLHHSSVIWVDLTALRPNCFMELGYALGNRQRVILSARDDTRFPFDAFALEAFMWKEAESLSDRRDRLLKHWERNFDMPKLVKAREAR
ncbi:MAG: hypothetical protein JNK76_03750 [Planctomycetales bacterium]|nr:hypothetical protein [Planctomycetales bacterium]MBN8625548.1 hypothetical protein [Planctomycetota bacterium]